MYGAIQFMAIKSYSLPLWKIHKAVPNSKKRIRNSSNLKYSAQRIFYCILEKVFVHRTFVPFFSSLNQNSRSEYSEKH